MSVGEFEVALALNEVACQKSIFTVLIQSVEEIDEILMDYDANNDDHVLYADYLSLLIVSSLVQNFMTIVVDISSLLFCTHYYA